MAASITKTKTIKHYVPLNETHKITFKIVFRKRSPNLIRLLDVLIIYRKCRRQNNVLSYREGNEQNPGKQSAFFKQNNCKKKKKEMQKKLIYELIKLKTNWIFYIMDYCYLNTVIFSL